MIFIQPYQMKHLLKRRTVTIRLPATHGYRVGHNDYADTTERRSMTRITVTKVAGASVHIRAVLEEIPVYMAARPGPQRADYTADPSRAMFTEPEAVTGPELARITQKTRREREVEVAMTKARILREITALTANATRAERRRLRNLERAATAL